MAISTSRSFQAWEPRIGIVLQHLVLAGQDVGAHPIKIAVAKRQIRRLRRQRDDRQFVIHADEIASRFRSARLTLRVDGKNAQHGRFVQGQVGGQDRRHGRGGRTVERVVNQMVRFRAEDLHYNRSAEESAVGREARREQHRSARDDQVFVSRSDIGLGVKVEFGAAVRQTTDRLIGRSVGI